MISVETNSIMELISKTPVFISAFSLIHYLTDLKRNKPAFVTGIKRVVVMSWSVRANKNARENVWDPLRVT